jgi:hypothetical protein
VDASNPDVRMIGPPSDEGEIPFDGAVAVWDFWLRRLYLEALGEMERRRLD